MPEKQITVAQIGASLMGLGCFMLFGVPLLFLIVIFLLALVGVI